MVKETSKCKQRQYLTITLCEYPTGNISIWYWTLKMFFVAGVCSPFGSFENGRISYNESTVLNKYIAGTKVTIMCDWTYGIVGPGSTLTCQELFPPTWYWYPPPSLHVSAWPRCGGNKIKPLFSFSFHSFLKAKLLLLQVVSFLEICALCFPQTIFNLEFRFSKYFTLIETLS